jgi:hypothetical protein
MLLLIQNQSPPDPHHKKGLALQIKEQRTWWC